MCPFMFYGVQMIAITHYSLNILMQVPVHIVVFG